MPLNAHDPTQGVSRGHPFSSLARDDDGIPTRAELEMSIDITAERVKAAEEDLLQAAEEYFVAHDRLEAARTSHERAITRYRSERMWAR